MRQDNFDSESYVKVNERLAEFRKTFPEGFETTFRTESPEGVVYKALLFRNKDEVALFRETGIAAASGHSHLPAINKRGEKVEEYTETVALGRALAKLGFKVEKSIASSEEMVRFSKNKEEAVDEVLNSVKDVKLKTASPFKGKFSKKAE